MNKTFYSRVDFWYYLVILFLLWPIYEVIASGDLTAICLMVLVLALVCSMFYCVYRIEGETLRVQCGPFPYPKMQIQEIVSVRKTRTILSSPALSLDRIAVTSVKGRILIISPKQRVEFVKALLIINPNIKVDEECLLEY